MAPNPRTVLSRPAAVIYAAITAGVVAFQLALAGGAPWGQYAMGGAFPGQFPPGMRVGAVIQAMLLAALAVIVLGGAGLTSRVRPQRWILWAVVGFSALSLFLNLITPSTGERAIWAPVAFGLLLTSAIVAASRPRVADP